MTMAEHAREFIRRNGDGLPPASIHMICNRYIDALRSGSRRRAHRYTRAMLRNFRAAAAHKMKGGM
jgi:hypothetical protein